MAPWHACRQIARGGGGGGGGGGYIRCFTLLTIKLLDITCMSQIVLLEIYGENMTLFL